MGAGVDPKKGGAFPDYPRRRNEERELDKASRDPLQKNRMARYRREADCWPEASGPAYYLLRRWIAFYLRCLKLTESVQILTWLWTGQSEPIWTITQRRGVIQ